MGADLDGLSMETGPTRDAMVSLSAAGGELTAGWSDAASRIAAAAGRLGAGPMGQGFQRGYSQLADEVAGATDAFAPMPAGLADTGLGCVASYVTADATGRAAFPTAAASIPRRPPRGIE